MAITRYLDGHDKTYNFETAYTGPGIYVLYDGRIGDANIVYIGKSTSDVMLRVNRHRDDKDFDGVGVILPAHTDPDFIHDLEAMVMMEYRQSWGVLPPYNVVQAHILPGRRRFNWTAIARRENDVLFS